ncbi:hypothetical protein BJ322DRAFT_1078244 [Thelephora terrestris]|uniref:DUF6533 domain-containing protein n=1 Tax=Thelephora terrestris TaxID=56493 RepID=A0A9P6H8U2_9AGAM|nr:hypothetical protein BJ322DRAFT_1078244 [Thelephora terrestris]
MMEGEIVAELTKAGEVLFMSKLLLASVQCLWVYDYLLTIGDEVRYAWHGKKSWVFALFIANRYISVAYIVWLQLTMFHNSQLVSPFCQWTKWVPVFQPTTTTALAQIAVTLRVYAITRKNKLIGGILALQIAGGIGFGIFSVVRAGLGPVQALPDINLDEFRICVFKLWSLGELIYYNSAIVFDIVVFVTIIITARRQRINGHPGIPSILDTVVRDATGYFMLIVSFHFLSVVFVLVAPEDIQLIPGMANTVLVPVMASRLMLSLKKASAEPKAVWSLKTMTNATSGELAEDGTIRFAARVPGRFHGSAFAPAASDREYIELDATP